jgi:hypothetical protein
MKQLNRRTFLRGAAGAALSLPLLDVMMPSKARAQTVTFPKRVLFVFQPNGDEIAARFVSRGETNFVLGEFLEPLEPHRNEILIIEGLEKRYGEFPDSERADNHEQGGSCLAPWPSGEGSFPVGGTDRYIGYVQGPSADYAIGDRVIRENPGVGHRHLVYRVGGQGNNIWNLHSHAGPVGSQNPVPPEVDPWASYARIFDSFQTGEAQTAVLRRLAMKQSALDLVLQETNALKAKLGTNDRLKLERHTESLRDIERTLQAMNTGSNCVPIDIGSAVGLYDDDNHEVIGRAFFKIIAMAFACDLTRSVQFNWSGNTSNRVYRNLGLTEGHHDISHNSDANSFTTVRQIHRHLWTLNTQLYAELKAIAEGDGTVWDNTLIVHWNELGQGDTHDISNNLVVFTGGNQGYFRMGRYVDLRNNARNGFSDMLVSCFQYMGFGDVTEFGDPRLSSGGPLPNLT